MQLRTLIPSEAQEQKALVQWMSYHPIVRDYFYKNDNEGKRSRIGGHENKLMGLKSGVSDIFLFYPTLKYHGLFLEVKRKKLYTMSERSTKTWLAQEKFLELVKSVGFAGETCYGWENGRIIIENYLLS